MKIRVKVFNEQGYWLLSEIRGLKEGDVIHARRDKHISKAFNFKRNGSDAVLWLGINCEIVEDQPVGKQKYIEEIKQFLGCEYYVCFWCTPDYKYILEDKKEAQKHLRYGEELICLVEFYKHQDSDTRTDYMHGKNEYDCLSRLYDVLGLRINSNRHRTHNRQP